MNNVATTYDDKTHFGLQTPLQVPVERRLDITVSEGLAEDGEDGGLGLGIISAWDQGRCHPSPT